MSQREALVLGAGVIGLTSAIRLQEAGYRVRLLARGSVHETTSAVAAAVWYPYRAEPREKVLAWGTRTLDVLTELARDPATGCSIAPVIELFDRPTPDPWWKSAVPRFRRTAAAELREGYVDGFTLEVPLIETPVYLDYLVARFAEGGGHTEYLAADLDALEPLCAEAPVVVNCTGLGAAKLCNDPACFPIRGQVVRVTNPGLRTGLVDDYGPLAMTYIIPRRHDVILGGTADDGVWDTAVNPETTREILRKSVILEPRLRQARVIEARVGLRPGRSAVRLEAEAVGQNLLIHNYGHGGSGHTLAWGCAEAVVALADSATA